MSRFERNKGPLALLGSWLLLAGGLLALPGTANAAAPPEAGKLIVHEWGTFLSVQSPEGTSLGGMIESEEELPNFVRERGLDGGNRACLNYKMETPVTYFYVDRPRTVEVRVDMPNGLLTHWFPAVRTFGPPQKMRPSAAPVGSFLDWGKVRLTPAPRGVAPGLRSVSATDPWRFVRDTDAALVHVGNDRPRVRPSGDTEKFLFYRGLGALDMPLTVRTTECRAGRPQLELHNGGIDLLRGIFVVQVEAGTIRFSAVGDMIATCPTRAGIRPVLGDPHPLSKGVPEAKRKVADALIGAGLYRKEAEAMVNNWEKSYFRTEGLRVLYLIPRARVERTIPLRIAPAPQELVRVMVGRVEVLTPTARRKAESALAVLGGRPSREAGPAEAELARLGRLREPVLRHLAATSGNAAVRSKAEELVKKVVAVKR